MQEPSFTIGFDQDDAYRSLDVRQAHQRGVVQALSTNRLAQDCRQPIIAHRRRGPYGDSEPGQRDGCVDCVPARRQADCLQRLAGARGGQTFHRLRQHIRHCVPYAKDLTTPLGQGLSPFRCSQTGSPIISARSCSSAAEFAPEPRSSSASALALLPGKGGAEERLSGERDQMSVDKSSRLC
jgi:hypothetical protein